MPIKLKNNTSLTLGNIYQYADQLYLTIRSDYEKSKGYPIKDVLDLSVLNANSIVSFYNEDVTLAYVPSCTEVLVEDIKAGDYVLQDGLIYKYVETTDQEVLFNDFPTTNCPIYFIVPEGNNVNLLVEYIKYTTPLALEIPSENIIEVLAI